MFCLSHVLILSLLGEPDLGVLFANYLGYWLMGVLLIAVGMVASLLSSNVTVAFILGAVFCGVPVLLNLIGAPVIGLLLRLLAGNDLNQAAETWSVPAQFQPFATGVITLSGLIYFAGGAAVMLYLSMALLGRRHWACERAAHGLHRAVDVERGQVDGGSRAEHDQPEHHHHGALIGAELAPDTNRGDEDAKEGRLHG